LVAKLSVRDFDAAWLAAKLSLAACEAVALVAKLSVVAVFADRFWFEDRFALAFNAAAPLEELVPVCDAFLVALPATAPSDALVVFDELPLPAELAGVLEELLLKEEVPVLVAVPFAPAAAKFRVPFEADVLLFALE